MVQREQVEDSLPSPHEKPQKPDTEDVSERRDPKLPPTPISSSSSILQKEAEALKDGKADTDTGGLTGITRALKDFVVSKSVSAASAKGRRHTAAPVSATVVANPVHAEISNPITSASPPETSNPQKAPSSVPDKNVDSLLRRLTIDATDGSREKSTPPYTPRPSNHEVSRQEPRPSASEQNGLQQEARGISPASDNEKPSRRTSGVSVGPPKGRLLLKISEARGLRPSYDPYIVSTFEWSEFISKGPKHDAMELDHDEKKSRKEALSSVPIRRTDSDVGKPMAIPMKSRQSSQNSQLDKTEAKNSTMVTDPRWEHEAVLYAILSRPDYLANMCTVTS